GGRRGGGGSTRPGRAGPGPAGAGGAPGEGPRAGRAGAPAGAGALCGRRDRGANAGVLERDGRGATSGATSGSVKCQGIDSASPDDQPPAAPSPPQLGGSVSPCSR